MNSAANATPAHERNTDTATRERFQTVRHARERPRPSQMQTINEDQPVHAPTSHTHNSHDEGQPVRHRGGGPALTPHPAREPVTFQAVQREAGVSQNFLYKNADLRARIEHQRRTHRPAPRPVVAEGDSSNNIVAALTAEVARLKNQHRQEVTELRKALEEAHGKKPCSSPRT